jgi:hypothetical protein
MRRLHRLCRWRRDTVLPGSGDRCLRRPDDDD